MTIRLLLNGKKAAQDDIRHAVYQLRQEGHSIDVRTTWETGDIARLVSEAKEQGINRVVAGGGDGTVNEVVDAILSQKHSDLDVAILPLGTANDFASACGIPTDNPYEALKLALDGNAHSVDAARANDRFFINIATAGFGAQVTATTPVALKNFLGGGAYTLSGLIQAINFQPFKGAVRYDNQLVDSNIVIGAVCNGRMAGGGQVLASRACIDDGWLDVISLEEFEPIDIPNVLEELLSEDTLMGRFVKRNQVKTIEWLSDSIMPVNLDGEPLSQKRITFDVIPSAIQLVVPNHCSLLSKNCPH
ncbi:lipid kinase YegS [Vibrio sp. 10N.286.49.C2]|uniref:lipid kinase YegS n=1 Tax=unclassified Vibrio TaxID=2614977 RepID=UPI000C864F15|nr:MULTISPECIES: lipid kinase YegS [unclassified Vibrio]PMH37188.1 lipid kinase YegS [Vibrio sp. 10N.286.49.C2]PMH57333.1 lipid kinase YegS [Vibrio sp. 10N.286.49.B1]PMH79696.1 lipid kinase YegS [Vibrio sp. 10N.286.48.B7]